MTACDALRMRTHTLSLTLLLCAACLSIPTAREANISYSTEPSAWPEAASCLNPPVKEGVAKEVLIGSRREVVIAGGADEISDEAWETYTPSLGNQKNSDRHVLFTTSCFTRSPGVPADCEGEACREIIDLDGYTWIGLSKIVAADCVPSASACDGTNPKEGGLLFIVTEKCHELVFEGDVVYLNGPEGEKAIMHATPDGVPTTDVVLPEGWTLTAETLAEPLTVHPFGGGDQCFYNIIRDSKVQSYHQIAYAGATYP
jgi:hypothetical protein